MRNFEKKIEDIKKAKENNRLVIFVGAGVSQNSNLPGWGGLIKRFDKELKADNFKEEAKYSSDEYLKIPEYYYISKGEKEYTSIIKDELDIPAEPNLIHELIFKLNPKHIITTNYDKLLESTNIPQRKIFDVISKDIDFLKTSTNNYIIKMHGDIKDLNNIVLKESDYLNYSQNHILIETFIKSLMVTNTFLFIGYSLNDYNFKQIISWVEMLVNSSEVTNKRMKNYIIQEIKQSEKGYIEEYYAANNIYIIDPNEVPEEYKNQLNSETLKEKGKDLYATLSYIRDYPNNLLDKFYADYQLFKKQNRVAIQDLFSVYNFKNAKKIDDVLCIYSIKNEEAEVLRGIIESNARKEKFVKEIWIKAGIHSIEIISSKGKEEYQLIEQKDIYCNESLLELEMNNAYSNIMNKLEELPMNLQKAYYNYILGNYGKSEGILSYIQSQLFNDTDHYMLLVLKFNELLIKQTIYFNHIRNFVEDFNYIYENMDKTDKRYLSYIKNIFDNNIEERFQMVNLKNKHKNTYLKADNSVMIGGDILKDFYELKALAYNYYYYIKLNHIMIDSFSNPKTYLESYINSMLCTYSPKRLREKDDDFFPDYHTYNEYIIEEVDLEFLIKYINNKDLFNLLKEYQVKEIKVDKNIKLVTKFSNLCSSLKHFGNKNLLNYCKNFITILGIVNLTKDEVDDVLLDIGKVIMFKGWPNCNFLYELQKSINFFLIKHSSKLSIGNSDFLNAVLDINLIKETIADSNMYTLRGIFEKLKNCVNEKSIEYIDSLIAREYENNHYEPYIYVITPLFNEKQKSLFSTIVVNKLGSINSISHLNNLILEGYILFNETVENKFLNIIKGEIAERELNPGIKSFPDWLGISLESIVYFYLNSNDIQIEKYAIYKEWSHTLSFILNPMEFDYKKINLKEPIWRKIFFNENFRNEIISYGKEQVSKKLQESITSGYATEEERKIFYRYFDE
ncbi:hypothetical protein COJ21_09855 [Priestia megaterium]|uniref:SIR2 family protein n=1 Tax=Priestia megaterium TaxID=1404 RepID=UPI000BF9C0BB|nr:SIR2 family protein [Priestia megaterium]PFK77415.1 hypothetical protein COJ21_09855 [Priestia megaterium]